MQRPLADPSAPGRAAAAASPRRAGLRDISPAIWIAGATWLALVAWGFALRMPTPFHGYEIYDFYYAAILDGRLDLPPRTLRFEGHYAADGTGYLYHGAVPLLTRFAFGWAWPFERLSMSGPSIWLWAVVGTAGYQGALVGLARRAGVWATRRRAVLAVCAGLWLAGPGVILVANQSFYHEPIAFAFAATGLFVAAWVGVAQGRLAPGVGVAILAGLAATVVHARPNLAIGLYAAVGLAVLWGVWRHRAGFLAPAALAGLLLGAGGLGFLALNEARFGSATQFDGSFTESGRIYGAVFWGHEQADSERARAAEEHGRFNLRRVLPNLMLYAVDLPPQAGAASEALRETHRGLTEPVVGQVRIERPRVGMVFLWPLWILLAGAGLMALRRDPAMAALVVGLALSAGLMLSYMTVTMRYRVDLWPLIGVLAILGTVRLLRDPPGLGTRWAVPVLLAAGLLGSLGAGWRYSWQFQDSADSAFFAPWSYETCAEIVRTAGFPEAELPRLCREPSMGGA
ncbi:hypothetical protein [Jannaschia formosa]|uniref:hypothetical protein n=1 Tax=Jannaschia formosa TaxID=2259592 RepID=UPI000E1B5FFF|nr:hypothetical protein [Jannaschia formosa]TFL18089.1 hypothetical protein DR046_11650 [Jannaschia formosa]